MDVGAKSDPNIATCGNPSISNADHDHDAIRTAHIVDTVDRTPDIANGTRPAVSFVKASGGWNGHPASSKFDLFEGFVKRSSMRQSNEELWATTAIFITVDEGGG